MWVREWEVPWGQAGVCLACHEEIAGRPRWLGKCERGGEGVETEVEILVSLMFFPDGLCLNPGKAYIIPAWEGESSPTAMLSAPAIPSLF